MEKFDNVNLDFTSFYIEMKKALSIDTTIREFQNKIVHRILATNHLLFKMKISDYDLCTFCFSNSETIEHIFWDCMDIKNLWFRINSDLNLKEILGIEFDKLTILLGYTGDHDICKKSFNIFIVSVKYYIYKCKLGEKFPNYDSLKKDACSRCRIYKNINTKLNFEFIQYWD